MIIDLHVHSNTSFDSKIKIGILLKKLKEIGLDGIAITDHDSVAGIPKAKELAKKYHVKVFTGVEISTNRGHLLAYGIDEKPIYRKSVAETIDWIKDRDGAAVCAHPFRASAPSIGDMVYEHHFDGIELNGRTKSTQNRAAEVAAKLMKITLVGGSDAHMIQRVGKISTQFHNEFTNDGDLVQAIRKGQCDVKLKIPITIKAQLIPAISAKDIDILEKYKPERRPLAPIIKVSNEKVKFIDSK